MNAPEYSHPRMADPEAGTGDWEGMAMEARAAVQRREKTYPDLVKTERLDREVAKADLLVWRIIARDWEWIATGEGLPATRATLHSRIAALDTAIDRFFANLDRGGGAPSITLGEREQITRLAAMRWWAERELTQPERRHARDNAAIGHRWRQENGFPPLGQMRAAQQQPEQRNAA